MLQRYYSMQYIRTFYCTHYQKYGRYLRSTWHRILVHTIMFSKYTVIITITSIKYYTINVILYCK